MSCAQVLRKALGTPSSQPSAVGPVINGDSVVRLDRLAPELILRIMEHQLDDDPHDVQSFRSTHTRFHGILCNHKYSLLTRRCRSMFGVNYADALAVVRCPIREVDEERQYLRQRIKSHLDDLRQGRMFNDREHIRDLEEYEAMFQLNKSINSWIGVWLQHPWEEDLIGTFKGLKFNVSEQDTSSDMHRRFQRGFLRYELYCRCFFQQATKPLCGLRTRKSLFFDHLPPWQQEEAACVMSFVARYYEMRVDKVREEFLRDLEAKLDGPAGQAWIRMWAPPESVWPDLVDDEELNQKLGYLSEIHEVIYQPDQGFVDRPHLIKTGFSILVAMGLDSLERTATWDTDVFGQKLKELWLLLDPPPLGLGWPRRTVFAHDVRLLSTPWGQPTDELERQMKQDPLGCPRVWRTYYDFALQSFPSYDETAHIFFGSELRIAGWVFREQEDLETSGLVNLDDLIRVGGSSWLQPDHDIFNPNSPPCRMLKLGPAEELLRRWGVDMDQERDSGTETGLNVESADGKLVRFWEL